MSVRVKVTIAWWFRYLYLPGIYTMAMLGLPPDQHKIAEMLKRALTVKIEMIPGIIPAQNAPPNSSTHGASRSGWTRSGGSAATA